eukprot:7975615-Alexandrium_andersonii.AAC.1
MQGRGLLPWSGAPMSCTRVYKCRCRSHRWCACSCAQCNSRRTGAPVSYTHLRAHETSAHL